MQGTSENYPSASLPASGGVAAAPAILIRLWRTPRGFAGASHLGSFGRFPKNRVLGGSPKKRVFSQAGFTLIEVMVSVTILAIMSVLLWQSMGTSSKANDRAQKGAEVFYTASLALDLMTRDLQMAFLFSGVDFLGMANGQQAVKYAFVGTDYGDQDKLSFNTFSHIRYLRDSKESDQAEVTYSLEKNNEGSGQTFKLKKRWSSPPDTKVSEGGREVVLLDHVIELNFRYFDVRKQEYVDEWDTNSIDYVNRLPRAVEILLVVRDTVDEEEEDLYGEEAGKIRFSTVTLLEMSPGPNDF